MSAFPNCVLFTAKRGVDHPQQAPSRRILWLINSHALQNRPGRGEGGLCAGFVAKNLSHQPNEPLPWEKSVTANVDHPFRLGIKVSARAAAS